MTESKEPVETAKQNGFRYLKNVRFSTGELQSKLRLSESSMREMTQRLNPSLAEPNYPKINVPLVKCLPEVTHMSAWDNSICKRHLSI